MGQDFGTFALRLSRFFQIMRPGCPGAGQRVRIPIRFALAPDS